jgi:hypothetical protein
MLRPAGPGPRARRRPDLSNRHPQQPGPAAADYRRVAGRTRPAPPAAGPGPAGPQPGAQRATARRAEADAALGQLTADTDRQRPGRPLGVGWAGADSGGAGAGQRRPPWRLSRGRVPAPTCHRNSRLDPRTTLAGWRRAGRRRDRRGCWPPRSLLAWRQRRPRQATSVEMITSTGSAQSASNSSTARRSGHSPSCAPPDREDSRGPRFSEPSSHTAE